MSKHSNLSEAGSWCRTIVQTKKFPFKWTIENFKKWRKPAGHFLESSPFPEGNHEQLKFRLVFYPKGTHEEQEHGQTVLCLQLVSSKEPSVCVTYAESTILTVHERPKCMKITYSPTLSQWEEAYFQGHRLTHDHLIRGDYLSSNGKLTITCEVTAMVDPAEISGRDTAGSCSQQPARQRSDDLGSILYQSKKFSDVILMTDDGQEFVAHKAVLAARSTVFAAMFEHDMKEKAENRVEIKDLEPEVLQGILCFIYTGKVSDILTNKPEGLLIAADRYALDSLKCLCEEPLSSKLTTARAAEVLILADLHKANQLKSKAISFIRATITDVMLTDGWVSLAQTHPHLLAEVFRPPATQSNCPIS